MFFGIVNFVEINCSKKSTTFSLSRQRIYSACTSLTVSCLVLFLQVYELFLEAHRLLFIFEGIGDFSRDLEVFFVGILESNTQLLSWLLLCFQSLVISTFLFPYNWKTKFL